jgi:hypothetical protein
MTVIKNTTVILLLLFALLAAQEESEEPEYGWQKELVGNLNFTQNSFDNWSQGGEDSWSWALELRGKFINDQETYNWSNSGKFSFGKTKVGDSGARKAADEIKLESVYTYKLGIHLNPYVSVTAHTQFAEGFKYEADTSFAVSNFMDPGYFTESIGLGYEPVKNFKTRIGAAMKQTITDEFPVPYADDPETEKIEKTRNEFGIESVTDYSAKLNEIVIFTTKLELFSNAERFDEIDVNWDNLINAKVSKYITVSFNLKLFYDKDISTKRQLQQTLAVGLSYNFI